jgi:hypothetical protein
VRRGTAAAWLLGLLLASGGARGVRAQSLDAGRSVAEDARSPLDAERPLDAREASFDAPVPLDAGPPFDADDTGQRGAGLDGGTAHGAPGPGGDAGSEGDGVIEVATGEPAATSVLAGESLVENAATVALELSREPTTGEVLRTLLGLLGLLALAWLAGQPRVRRLEQRFGITHVATSGLPFVFLGLLLRAPGVDVLNESVLASITPLLQFGLGWIGFHTGFQFEARSMNQVPRGTSSVVIALTSAPFALTTLGTGVALLLTGLAGPRERLMEGGDWTVVVRDACLLGLAGALSAPRGGRWVKGREDARALASTVAVLDDVLGVLALALLAAWLRPANEGGWQVSGVGWLFITLGMAATLGLVVHFALTAAESVGERTALLLGSVAFTAGLAGYASLTPLVVCFLAGLVLRNVPGGDKTALETAFTRLERPVYLLFLTIVGALWRLDDWRGWVLLVFFVLTRLAGRSIGATVVRRFPPAHRPDALSVTPDAELIFPPMGQLAIAFVVAAQTLYESPAIPAVVTAVIGGSIVSELLGRIATEASSDDERLEHERPAPRAAEGVATPPAPSAPAESAPADIRDGEA